MVTHPTNNQPRATLSCGAAAALAAPARTLQASAGPIRVRALRPGDDQAWDEFVWRHPFGTPFHLLAWKDSVAEVFGYHPLYFLAADRAGVRGVLPLFHVSNCLTGKALISTPFAVYGGVLADSNEVRQALRRKLEQMAERLNVGYAELRNAQPEQCVELPHQVLRYVTFTQAIGPDEAVLLEGIPRKTRRMVRKSLDHGFSTRREFTDIQRFETLYADSLRRLGTPSFPPRFFTALLHNFRGMIDIREVVCEGVAVAAVMSFYFRDQVLPYYGASDPRYHAKAPNNYMYFDLMRAAGAEGYRLFDFGRSKKDSGSYDFKSHWGMQERELPYEVLLVRKKELPNYSPNNPKFRAVIRVWQHLPLALTRRLGPFFLRLVP